MRDAFYEHSITKFSILVLKLVLKDTVPLLFIYFDLPLRFVYFIDLYGIRGRLLRYFIYLYTYIRILS